MTTNKIPTKKMDFDEKDEAFVKQLANDIGCYYSKANPRTYSLNRHDSSVQGEMGVFAWVHKQEAAYFWVATRKVWIEAARAKENAGMVTPQASSFPRNNQRADDSVILDAKNNYDQTISSLRLIHQMG